MAIRCGNCGGYFSFDEVATRKPPQHPWKLTPAGAQVLQANAAVVGNHPQCPSCGQRTLVQR